MPLTILAHQANNIPNAAGNLAILAVRVVDRIYGQIHNNAPGPLQGINVNLSVNQVAPVAAVTDGNGYAYFSIARDDMTAIANVRIQYQRANRWHRTEAINGVVFNQRLDHIANVTPALNTLPTTANLLNTAIANTPEAKAQSFAEIMAAVERDRNDEIAALPPTGVMGAGGAASFRAILRGALPDRAIYNSGIWYVSELPTNLRGIHAQGFSGSLHLNLISPFTWNVPGGNAAQAIRDFLIGPTVAECASVIQAAMYGTLLRAAGGNVNFNNQYSQLRLDKIFSHTGNNPLATNEIDVLSLDSNTASVYNNRLMQEGIWCYIKNGLQYLNHHPNGFGMGWNLVSIGESGFLGFGLGDALSEGAILDRMVNGYNSGLAQNLHITRQDLTWQYQPPQNLLQLFQNRPQNDIANWYADNNFPYVIASPKAQAMLRAIVNEYLAIIDSRLHHLSAFLTSRIKTIHQTVAQGNDPANGNLNVPQNLRQNVLVNAQNIRGNLPVQPNQRLYFPLPTVNMLGKNVNGGAGFQTTKWYRLI
ncbi:hypothetical protein [Baaleninema simplex]|uniref:hypothetical protein n=1 Tax=Baaleninema simplex TaxID=2862350 RepID=UPI0003453209|nr:hypothetical protein [Baaleninema simplex]